MKSKDFLDNILNYEKKIDLLSKNFERQFINFKKFIEKKNNPQFKFKTIHIVGSKGKGSTGFILSYLLKFYYKRVGLFTSPHLIDVKERIKINNKNIKEKIFLSYLKRIEKDIVDNNLSYFEILTYISFLYFKEEKIDIGIYEAGLGGRLDATNVLNPEVIIITTIEKEHQRILGNTLEKIAKEKFAVIKNKSVVFSQKQNKDIEKLLIEKIKKTKSKLFYEGKDFNYEITKHSLNGIFFNFFLDKKYRFSTSLINDVQIKNVSIVLAVLFFLIKENIDNDKILKGLKDVRIKGRFEIVKRNPFIIFDVAHTYKSFYYLIKTLNLLFKDREKIFILTFYKDKKIDKILSLLKKHGVSFIYYLETEDKRSYSFKEFFFKYKNITDIKALNFRKYDFDNNKVYIFAGSFSIYKYKRFIS